jgi:hypothetical protein
VPQVEQELLTRPEYLSSPLVFSGVRVTRFLVLCVMFCRSFFVLLFFFLLAIVLSVLRFTDSEYPFGLFKLFFININLIKRTSSDDNYRSRIRINGIFRHL